MTMPKAVLTGGIAVVACAACCAPLLTAPILALIAAGGAGLALAGKIGLGAGGLAALAAAVILLRRRMTINRVPLQACGCSADSPCGSGAAPKSPGPPAAVSKA